MRLLPNWYTLAADQGLTRAAVALGAMYESGRGVELDIETAAKYYQIAVLGRSEIAAQRLGSMLVTGAIPPDLEPEAGIRWVATAAAAGDADARRLVADPRRKRRAVTPINCWPTFTARATGVDTDPDKAAKYYTIAAQAGLPFAQFQLGRLFAAGTGVAQDFIEAHKWANVAAANGVEEAAETRDTYAQLMTPEQIAEAQQRARVWMKGN